MMPSNAEIIEMHLFEMLNETKQIYTIHWDAVLGYCLGYYGEITMDHLVAVMNLERLGYLKRA